MSSWNKYFILKSSTASRIIKPSTAGLTGAVACGLIQPSIFPIKTALGVTGFKLAEISIKNLLAACLSYQGWLTHPKSAKTKIWAFCLKLLQYFYRSETFSYQKLLPKQPLPPLDVTLDKWADVSQYFVTEEEYKSTRDAIESFRKNEGPKLQKYLYKRFKTLDNWVSNYWIQAAYLSNRNSLAANSNYSISFKLTPERTPDYVARAACVVTQMLRYNDYMMENRIKPVMLMDMVPLCMAGYRYLYGTCRVPGEDIDSVVKDSSSSHIVVIRLGHYFKLDCYITCNNIKRRLTAYEMKQQLQKIIEKAESLGTANRAVASLTAQNRSVWAKDRKALSVLNKETLDDIESSLFVLNLDTYQPKTPDDLSRSILIGDGFNRWFDKGFNLVIYDNGLGGSNVEHSFIDAWVYTTLGEFLLCNEYYENGDVVKLESDGQTSLQPPVELVWELDDHMVNRVESAQLEMKTIIENFDLRSFLAPYSKGQIKKFKLSPDGYIQMMLQLAYNRLHKHTPKTYEPATSRLFLLGRTETIHPASQYSRNFVLAMDDKNSNDKERIHFLKEAIKYQGQFRLDATKGDGCDRHLFALYCASRELGMDIPLIFQDKVSYYCNILKL
ncbi:DgyrCDS3338 [Dimorphilus gyrociliatus]|uniref:DgyrCDS3338 n=1 Tax=Dimorphilus gyrociliatus TaxID=2664684 RepID=A0A7I8VFY1_9ANNE|nr:DgyrCDS3338 [Dimorphilus gyrociliatus]